MTDNNTNLVCTFVYTMESNINFTCNNLKVKIIIAFGRQYKI